MPMKIKNMVLMFLCSTVAASAADSLSTANRQARMEALRTLQNSTSSHFEGMYLAELVAKYQKMGIEPGPFCIQLRSGCLTQRKLGYRSNEYFDLGEIKNISKAGIYTSVSEARLPSSALNTKFDQVAQANNVNPLTLLLAIDVKEKLELAYLAEYTSKHPNTPTKQQGDLVSTYSWAIDEDGNIVERVSTVGSGD